MRCCVYPGRKNRRLLRISLASVGPLALFVFLALAGGAETSLEAYAKGKIAAVEKTYDVRLVGAKTRGGAEPFGKIYHVTNLQDAGPGSLRYALHRTGPRIIVFDIAGIIHLKSDLKIFSPSVTIAGQTAPKPGITLSGATLRIRTSDVIVQHIAIRPGPSDNPKVSVKRDAITISQCSKCKVPPRGILIDQLTLTWSSDELIGIAGPNSRQITIRNCLLAEALNRSGHPKGSHSAAILIGGAARGVEIVGNLFANNVYRNPAVNPGGAVMIANNYIYNPHNMAVHVNAGPKSRRKTIVSVVGNLMEAGPDTRTNVSVVWLARNIAWRTPNAALYIVGNKNLKHGIKNISNPSGLKLRKRSPLEMLNWKMLPLGQVRNWVLRYAGSRPSKRNQVDKRIIEGVASRTGRIIDVPKQVGGLAARKAVHRVARVPKHPFSRSRTGQMLRIEVWLCRQHFIVGGAANAQCNSPSL